MKRLTPRPHRRRATPPDRPPDGNTEQRILDAAHAVFLRRGTAGARMQDIATEAGVNQALLHYYFRSKERLAEAVFRRAARQLLPAVIEVMASDAAARGESRARRRARARSPVAHAVPARLHHQRAGPSSRTRPPADRGAHRHGAGPSARRCSTTLAPADRRARARRHACADRARAVRRQPALALHLPVRRAADADGAARDRPDAASSGSSTRAASELADVLPESAAAMR